MSGRRRTIKAAISTGAGTLLSRLLGLGRDVGMATMFGVGAVMDGFFLAFLIPNLFRRLFGEGAMTGAVIPVVAEYREKGNIDDISRLVSRVVTLLALVLTGLTLLGLGFVFLMPSVGLGMADNPEKWSVFSSSLLVLSPLAVLLCVSGVLGGVSNAYGKFAMPALLPALQNIIWIGALATIAWLGFGGDVDADKIAVVCWAILAGGVIVTVIQILALRRSGILLRFDPTWKDTGVRSIVGMLAPSIFGIAVFQVNTLVDNLLAEWMVEGDGAVSAYAYATRVFQFPLGVVGIALGTAVFPLLAKHAARGEPAKLTAGLLNGLRLLAFIVFPAAAGLIAINHELVVVLLRHGAFDAEAAERTSRVLFFFSLALPIVAANQLVAKAFLALKDLRSLNRVALASVGINLIANVVLVQTPLREAGLALGTALSALFQLIALSVILYKRLQGSIVESGRLATASSMASDRMAQPISPSGLRRFKVSVLRSALISAAMCGTVMGVLALLPGVSGTGLREAAILGGAVAIGAAIYFVAHRVLGSDEIREVLARK